MKNFRLLKLFILTLNLFLLSNCENNNPTLTNYDNVNEKIQSKYDITDFSKVIPYKFDIDWNNKPSLEYFEELDIYYYEYPIIYLDKFNPNTIQKNNNNKYIIDYKFFVTEDKKDNYKFYILKLYREKEEKGKILEASLKTNNNFNGIIHLLNMNGDIVFAKKINKGIQDGKIFLNHEFKELRNIEENVQSKVDETCITVITFYYTDNYVVWGNGDPQYVSTTYNGFSTEEVCESYWLPNLNSAGGGGAGTYTNSGNGGVYQDCSGSDCKYVIDDLEIVTVVLSPDAPIADMEEYLECFDETQSAQFTIYVDQPKAGESDTWTTGNDKAGHAFISLTQGNLTRTWGLYPSGNANPFSPTDPHAFGNNSQNQFDVSITLTINSTSLQNILNNARNYNSNYNLNSNNCTDYAIQAAALAGINLPDPQGTWPNGSGSNPGTFGQALRNMPLTSGMSRNPNTGISAQNSTPYNCN